MTVSANRHRHLWDHPGQSPKTEAKNPNLAGDSNPAKNRRAAQGDGEQPTGAVICGTTQASHHSRSQEPLGGSRQQGGPVLRSWQYQRAARLVMLSTNWLGQSFGATLRGVWFIEWAEIVPQTAEIGGGFYRSTQPWIWRRDGKGDS